MLQLAQAARGLPGVVGGVEQRDRQLTARLGEPAGERLVEGDGLGAHATGCETSGDLRPCALLIHPHLELLERLVDVLAAAVHADHPLQRHAGGNVDHRHDGSVDPGTIGRTLVRHRLHGKLKQVQLVIGLVGHHDPDSRTILGVQPNQVVLLARHVEDLDAVIGHFEGGVGQVLQTFVGEDHGAAGLRLPFHQHVQDRSGTVAAVADLTEHRLEAVVREELVEDGCVAGCLGLEVLQLLDLPLVLVVPGEKALLNLIAHRLPGGAVADLAGQPREGLGHGDGVESDRPGIELGHNLPPVDDAKCQSGK